MRATTVESKPLRPVDPDPSSAKAQRELLAQLVLMLADRLNLQVATAESCTGGRLASLLTGIEGLSHRFECSFVAYSDGAKNDLLGVSAELVEQYGALSAQVAKAMAEGAMRRSRAGIAIAITGFAGPAGPGEKPGLVHFAVSDFEGNLVHTKRDFDDDDRGAVRNQALLVALEMLRDHLTRLKRREALREFFPAPTKRTIHVKT